MKTKKPANQERSSWTSLRGNQSQEVRELCESLGASPERVREAMRAAGYDGVKIREYLKSDKPA